MSNDVKVMPRGIGVLLVAAVSLLRADYAAACSCNATGPPCQDYWTAAAIFRGRVDAIDPDPTSGRNPFPSKLVRFTVLERFVGVEGPEITVWTAGSGAACGYRFALNREYIVYANRGGKDGRLSTGVCTRTAPAERAVADLEFARNIASGGQPLGLIEATVRLVIRGPSLWGGTETRSRPMPGVTITLRRGEESFSATTDRSGRFAISGLQPGTYYPEPIPPPGTRVQGFFPETIELLDARGCATFDVGLEPDGRVKGRVVDAGGRAVRGLTVGLRLPAAANRGPGLATNLQALTDSDGRFEIAGVPPGRFLLAAESGGPSQVLFPGVSEEAKAERLEVRSGGRVTVKDFRLQDVITITGVVVDGGRVPIEGARIFLRDPSDRGAIVSLPVVTDWSGRFVIAAPASQDYLIFAERDRPGASHRADASEPIRIGPRSPDQPLVLTLRPRY